jgi:hypothetical protein
MTTYRLGFYGFGELTVSTAAGQTGIASLTTADFGALDLQLGLVSATANLTPLLVVQVGADVQVAAGSGFANEGQAVSLERRLTMVADAPTPVDLTFDVLCLDGSPVGLLGSEPLQPDVIYVITRVTDGDTLAVLRSHGDAGGADAGARDAVVCFTHGTLVDTPEGPRLVEALLPGDLVTTLGSGSQPLRWTGSRHVPVAQMLQVPDLQPVEFAAGVIGNARPLRVSPQHRILLNDWRAQVFFGEDEVLIPAKAMVNGHTIRQILPAEGVTYIHLLFDRHEIIVSEGALSESFHPGEAGLLALDEPQRRELDLMFPGQELARRRAAFPIVKLSEARALQLPDHV